MLYNSIFSFKTIILLFQNTSLRSRFPVLPRRPTIERSFSLEAPTGKSTFSPRKSEGAPLERPLRQEEVEPICSPDRRLSYHRTGKEGKGGIMKSWVFEDHINLEKKQKQNWEEWFWRISEDFFLE